MTRRRPILGVVAALCVLLGSSTGANRHQLVAGDPSDTFSRTGATWSHRAVSAEAEDRVAQHLIADAIADELLAFDVADDLSYASLELSSGVVWVPLAFDPDVRTKQELVVDEGTIEYYSPALYRAIEAAIPGAVVLVSNFPHHPRVTTPPSDASTAASRWREAPRDLDELFADFERFAEWQGATICDERLPGATQYDAVREGRCYVWCTGYARITLDMLRARGTRARIVALDAPARLLPSGVQVLSSENHVTVERWGPDGWAWLDPTFRIGGAQLDGRSLSLTELILTLNDSSSRSAVTLKLYADRGWSEVGFADLEPALQSALLRYYTADKDLLVVP